MIVVGNTPAAQLKAVSQHLEAGIYGYPLKGRKMGASGWHYFTPYQSDIKAALQQLRQQVFVEGEYYKPVLFYTKLLKDIGDQLEPEVIEGLKRSIEEFRVRPEPQSIEELIKMNAEAGTHSIIDMHDIGQEPEIGIVSLMPEEMLIEVLGTLRPEHSQVERQIDELNRSIRSCHYLLVYEDETPSEIFFIGYSGD